jgi:hypothetical protein
MQRIVKRFLLHRDRESDDVNEMDFDELKQDLQMIRYEMNNDLKKSRDETTRILKHVNSGLLLLGEQMFKDCQSNDLLNRYSQYKATEIMFNDETNNIQPSILPSTSTYSNSNSNSKLSNDNDLKKVTFSNLNSIKEE